jgi:predicted DNA-binding transcriptional regulator AlpA
MEEHNAAAVRPLLTTEQLADYLAIEAHTVYVWRTSGKGPKWLKLNPGKQSVVRYRLEDVESWLKECESIER